jgi:RimJ/RimL family protein N-acetyltransferase
VIDLQLLAEDDLPLTERFLSDPEMMRYLGGTQSREQIVASHRRYLDGIAAGTAWMFKIVWGSDAVGTVGYWEKDWREAPVYEAGWHVFPEYQGRGLASEGIAAIVARARREGTRRFLHAFPSIENGPSNALCRKAGFTKLGECEFEYPKGHLMTCNDWRLDVRAVPGAANSISADAGGQGRAEP